MAVAIVCSSAAETEDKSRSGRIRISLSPSLSLSLFLYVHSFVLRLRDDHKDDRDAQTCFERFFITSLPARSVTTSGGDWLIRSLKPKRGTNAIAINRALEMLETMFRAGTATKACFAGASSSSSSRPRTGQAETSAKCHRRVRGPRAIKIPRQH